MVNQETFAREIALDALTVSSGGVFVTLAQAVRETQKHCEMLGSLEFWKMPLSEQHSKISKLQLMLHGTNMQLKLGGEEISIELQRVPESKYVLCSRDTGTVLGWERFADLKVELLPFDHEIPVHDAVMPKVELEPQDFLLMRQAAGEDVVDLEAVASLNPESVLDFFESRFEPIREALRPIFSAWLPRIDRKYFDSISSDPDEIFQQKKIFATGVTSLARELGLRFECTKCEHPSGLSATRSGNSKAGQFLFRHRVPSGAEAASPSNDSAAETDALRSTKSVSHSISKYLPELKVIVDRSRRRVSSHEFDMPMIKIEAERLAWMNSLAEPHSIGAESPLASDPRKILELFDSNFEPIRQSIRPIFRAWLETFDKDYFDKIDADANKIFDTKTAFATRVTSFAWELGLRFECPHCGQPSGLIATRGRFAFSHRIREDGHSTGSDEDSGDREVAPSSSKSVSHSSSKSFPLLKFVESK